jgi:hypothetical protein
MTFSTPWEDMKKVAFVPVFRESPDVVPPDVMPDNWRDAILNRVINDIRPAAGGVDRSLRAWLQRVSWGKANIDPKVFEIRKVTQKAVAPDHFAREVNPNPEQSLNEDHLKAQGFSSAILIMLGGAGAGTTSGFWSRVAWVEGNGIWLHEILHAITKFQDLYHFNNDVDPEDRGIKLFDIMSASQQTHPTAFTKNEFGWLDDRAIGRYTIGSGLRGFILHHVDSFRAPTHSGEVYAIRIGDNVPYIMVESRKKTDHWEIGISASEMGIPSEGVIAYRVRTKDPTIQVRANCRKSIYRENLTALQPGESITIGNANVRVESELTGGIGYIIHVTTDLTPEPGIGQVLVPNVVGMDWEVAEKAMVQAGICTRMSGPEGPKDKPAKIQSQLLPGGTLALFGTEITLVRSLPSVDCTEFQNAVNKASIDLEALKRMIKAKKEELDEAIRNHDPQIPLLREELKELRDQLPGAEKRLETAKTNLANCKAGLP